MATAADLKTAVDTLKSDVADLQARVAAQPPALITQAELDSAVSDIQATIATVKTLAPAV